MNYHLYLHDDFDGTICGALLLHFFRSRGEDVESYQFVSFTPKLKKTWPGFVFAKPFVIADFLYHPQADWWFDHHISSFLKPVWQAGFRGDKRHHFDSSYKSCYGMILNFLKREYGYRPNRQLAVLEKQADKIDSAAYESPREALTVKTLAQKLSFLIDSYEIGDTGGESFQRKAIKKLAFGDLGKFLSNPSYQKRLATIKKEIDDSFANYRRNGITKGRVSFLNKADSDLKILYAPFVGLAVFPDLEYTVIIYNHGNDYHISISRNHWLKKKSKINLGKLAQKYGGGGHKDIAGIEADTRVAALKVSDEIVEYLNHD